MSKRKRFVRCKAILQDFLIIIAYCFPLWIQPMCIELFEIKLHCHQLSQSKECIYVMITHRLQPCIRYVMSLIVDKISYLFDVYQSSIQRVSFSVSFSVLTKRINYRWAFWGTQYIFLSFCWGWAVLTLNRIVHSMGYVC